jgi:hypothetical protein
MSSRFKREEESYRLNSELVRLAKRALLSGKPHFPNWDTIEVVVGNYLLVGSERGVYIRCRDGWSSYRPYNDGLWYYDTVLEPLRRAVNDLRSATILEELANV